MTTFRKVLFLLLAVSIFSCTKDASFQQPSNETVENRANPSISNGVATYNANITIKARFKVPETWNKIIIKKNVTVKGNFIIGGPKRDFVIEGEDWNTSVLDGGGTTYVKGDRSLCNVRFENQGTLLLKNFKSLNPANFHITAWAPLTIDKMRIIDNRGQASTDAAHSTKGLTIKNSFISTYDDVLYVGECSKISYTTIEHNSNGAPFMCSWGGNADGQKTIADNVTIIDNSSTGYNHGVVGWAHKEDAGIQTATVEFINCTWKTATGKKTSKFYSFGGNRWGRLTDGARVIQKGGKCSWASSISQFDGSTGKVTTNNCSN